MTCSNELLNFSKYQDSSASQYFVVSIVAQILQQVQENNSLIHYTQGCQLIVSWIIYNFPPNKSLRCQPELSCPSEASYFLIKPSYSAISKVFFVYLLSFPVFFSLAFELDFKIPASKTSDSSPLMNNVCLLHLAANLWMSAAPHS